MKELIYLSTSNVRKLCDVKEEALARWKQRRSLGNFLSRTQRPSFVEMEKKKPEAELGGFEGLQMQPAATL